MSLQSCKTSLTSVVFWKRTMCDFLLAFLSNPSFSLSLPGNPFSCHQEPEECAVCLPSHSFILLTFPPLSCNPNRLGSALHPSDRARLSWVFSDKRIAARSCSDQGPLSGGEAVAFCKAGAVLSPVSLCPGWQLLCSVSLHVIMMCYRIVGTSTLPKLFPFPAFPCMVLPFWDNKLGVLMYPLLIPTAWTEGNLPFQQYWYLLTWPAIAIPDCSTPFFCPLSTVLAL